MMKGDTKSESEARSGAGGDLAFRICPSPSNRASIVRTADGAPMKRTRTTLAVLFGVACAVLLLAQEKEDRTLLSHDQMTAIINEVSGERAMHHVLELVPYQFVRPPAEYQSHFRESEVMARL